MTRIADQAARFRTHTGAFIAALDQSGGSTPKALEQYGVSADEWSGDDEMFDRVHQMRSRIMTSPVFTAERILAAILFENTMDREVAGKSTADYLWEDKGIVPILKVDQGLAEESEGVQLMKPLTRLDGLLERALEKHIFGTKMRSVIKQAHALGIVSLVDQQFEVAEQILAAGLTPIIEPEVDIHCPDKCGAEVVLHPALLAGLERIGADQQVIFKLTLPETTNLYADLIEHPKVLKVVALSGGYSREEANARLAKQHGMVASFSRALAEGLTAQLSESEFDTLLDASIQAIFDASAT